MNDKSNGITLLKIFNFIGGGLIFFGIAFFIGKNWFSLNNFVKVFSTLGAAIAVYIMGVLLHYSKKEVASSAFFMLAALILPIGLYVTLYLYAPEPFNFLKANLLVSFICLMVFLISQLVSTRTIFILFTIIFGLFFFGYAIDFIMSKSTFYIENLTEYEGLALGASYLTLGYYLSYDDSHPLSGPLYFFGTFFILAASYTIGGAYFYAKNITPWQIITGVLIFCFFMLSVPLKSKSILYVSALFLIGYLMDMSFRFANIFGNVGWPVILIFTGFLLMIVGYLVYYVHRKINR